MTKKLEDLLNLPDSQEIVKEDQEQSDKVNKNEIAEQEETRRSIAELDKISAALPQVKGLGEMADKELNEVSDKAMQAYEDLMDLGMNVEARFSGQIFDTASKMLQIKLNAKQSKVDKKLKMLELQIRKKALDARIERDSGQKGAVKGDAKVSSRNDLLDRNLNKYNIYVDYI